MLEKSRPPAPGFRLPTIGAWLHRGNVMGQKKTPAIHTLLRISYRDDM
ncbi:MAG: hypothetical protein LAP85_00695 [Acidobacteriia bacterium]|nr:hypothetical protein [Terriglobia bacterium]